LVFLSEQIVFLRERHQRRTRNQVTDTDTIWSTKGKFQSKPFMRSILRNLKKKHFMKYVTTSWLVRNALVVSRHWMVHA
jgi:hypothetical protein